MEKIFGTPKSFRQGDSEHWISVSDLMTGLMMVFLFISIALMRSALQERDHIKQVAVAYQEKQVAIYNALLREFQKDLPKWNAKIDRNTLAVRFNSPDVLFGVGSTGLTPRFQAILADFFPRYLKVLARFRTSITEVRIEGHTSSVWNRETSADKAYFLNMRLSQGRTRSVLQYVYELPTIAKNPQWVRKHVAAVGYSSSHLIRDSDGREDKQRSRRVTFRVVTNAKTQIQRILEE
jgi:outer membrane protein OmpA-like peptidoglycan-associated protein